MNADREIKRESFLPTATIDHILKKIIIALNVRGLQENVELEITAKNKMRKFHEFQF